MKIRNTHILLISLLISGCSSQLEKDSDFRTEEDLYPIEILSKNDFSVGDEIGIFPVGYVNGSPGILGDISNPMNLRYQFDGSSWQADNEGLFIRENSIDIYAYFPYDAELAAIESKLNLTDYPFEISGDQSDGKKDFLWAKSGIIDFSGSQTEFSFDHLFSRIIINIVSPSLEINGTSVYNTQTACSINLRTGEVTISGNNGIIRATPIVPPNSGYAATFEAIIIPQIVDSGNMLLLIDTENEPTYFSLPQSLTLNPGRSYTFNLTMQESQTNRSGSPVTWNLINDIIE